VRILVVYDSKSGNTEKMAFAVARGAEQAGAEVMVKRAEQVKNSDLQDADGIIMGSPTYFGQMTGRLKHIIDDSIQVHTKLSGKVGAAFASSGGPAGGGETTLLSILQAMLIHGMIIQGHAQSLHYGVVAVGTPKPADLKACEDMGARVAALVETLKA
jgi:NAD(P)H dehydrogenase (quinone)